MNNLKNIINKRLEEFEALIKNNIGIDEFITPKIGKIIELEKSE